MVLNRAIPFFSLALLALSPFVAAEEPKLGELAPLDERLALVGRQTVRRCRNPGWIPACPGALPCIPPGGICCSDGIHYAMPPQTCPAGTTPLTTAGSLPAPSSLIPTPTPSTSTRTIIQYTWYTFTVTYYYWFYYLSYDATTTLTLSSTRYTSTTEVSLTATDVDAASSALSQFTATAVFPTPTETAVYLSATSTKYESSPPVVSSMSTSWYSATSSVSGWPSVSVNGTISTSLPSSAIPTAGVGRAVVAVLL